MRALAMASASTAVSPPILRNSSRMCGANSAQCPSASMIGCFKRSWIVRASVRPWLDMESSGAKPCHGMILCPANTWIDLRLG